MNYNKLLIAASTIAILATLGCKDSDDSYLDIQCRTNSDFSPDTTTRLLRFAFVETDKYLDFDTLNRLSDTFRLRVEYYKQYQVNFFEFKRFNHQTTFNKYVFDISKDREGRILFNKQLESKNNFCTTFNPATKGKDFINQLKVHKILELTDCYDIQGYPSEDESRQVYIEYSNRCRYKFLHFNNPEFYRDKFVEAKNIAGFMDYLKAEFDF